MDDIVSLLRGAVCEVPFALLSFLSQHDIVAWEIK